MVIVNIFYPLPAFHGKLLEQGQNKVIKKPYDKKKLDRLAILHA